MTVDDRTRLRLHRRLEEVLGTEEADTLMSHLPPVTWNDVATKDDVRAATALTRADLRTEMADLRTDLRTEMADLGTDLRTEMADLGTELRTEMADLRIDVATQFGDLRSELSALESRMLATMHQAISAQTWKLTTFVCGWGALLVTAVGFLR